jgi:High-affinity nickel-transport protein
LKPSRDLLRGALQVRRNSASLRELEIVLPRQGSLSDLLIQIFDGQGGNLRVRLTGLYTFLIAANLAAWAWAFCSFHDHAVMPATALLAYSLGMRHAVDADHIAAIDNVTRKLMQEGNRPISAGFSFAFGLAIWRSLRGSRWLRFSGR